MMSVICEAIMNKQIVEFYYDGGIRVVEPHCYGVTTAGNPGLRAYQISGYSSSGSMGWKMFDLQKASQIKITDSTFQIPREGYRRDDRNMASIYCQL